MRIFVAALIAIGFASVISAAYAASDADTTVYIWRYRAEIIPSSVPPEDGGTGTMGE